MQQVRLPEMDNRLLQRLAEQVARISHQGINREHPLLAATLPAIAGPDGRVGSGARIQLVRTASDARQLGAGDPPPPAARSSSGCV